MSPLNWLILLMIVTGFIIVASMKNKMESKLTRLIAQGEYEAYNRDVQVIIYWIVATVVWGIGSMFLMIWMFNDFLR